MSLRKHNRRNKQQTKTTKRQKGSRNIEGTDRLKELLNNINTDHVVTPINPDPEMQGGNNEYHHILNDLQGNILNGHDRDYASHIFLKFNRTYPDPDRLRKMIKERAAKSHHHITSAKRQYLETQLYRKGGKIRGKLFVNFFFTANAYRFLFPDEDLDDRFNKDFLDGMANRDLNDPEPKENDTALDIPNEWISEQDIDVMILLADDDQDYLRRSELRVMQNVITARKGDVFDFDKRSPLEEDVDLAKVLTVQRGKILRNAKEQPIEHFGYLDGISNPLFLTSDSRRVNQFFGERFWKAWAPLNLALVPDPFGGEWSTGSYMVFRKLEQNVDMFQIMKYRLANEGLGDPLKTEFAGTLAVGRYLDGTPLTLIGNHRTEYDEQYASNDFTYGPRADGVLDLPRDTGSRCPMQAHIRKANPRSVDGKGPREDEEGERTHRIVRRGITYGDRDNELEQSEGLPQHGVGLLFICFQSNISKQFEYIQRRANGYKDPDDRKSFDLQTLDPIIGQLAPDQSLPQQVWPTRWNVEGQDSPPFVFVRCVSFKGGAYFFAPSISFLQNIAETRQGDDPLTKTFAEKGL